jgi:hypothetical protein
MEVNLHLQAHDAYEPVTLGMQPGVSMLFLGRETPNEVCFVGSPAEFRRLARALVDAAQGPPLGPPGAKGNGDPRP